MHIGITGEIGSGKTTLMEHLVKNHGYVEYTMANCLKMFGEIIGFSKEEMWGTQEQKLAKNKFWGVSGREFLQVVGTDLFRNILPQFLPQMKNIWARRFELECRRNPGVKYVIGDIRFLDEADALRRAGGVIIRVVRDVDRSGEEHKHESELELKKIREDFKVDNTLFSVEQARVLVDLFLGKVKGDLIKAV